MVNFLVFTCIKPQKKFFGLITSRIALILSAALISVCALYDYLESKYLFQDAKFLDIFNNEMLLAIQIIIALMVFAAFGIDNRLYSKLIYLCSFGLAGFSLAINSYKKSKVDEKYDDDDDDSDDKMVRWMYLIRIGVEFYIEIYACYILYSHSESPLPKRRHGPPPEPEPKPKPKPRSKPKPKPEPKPEEKEEKPEPEPILDDEEKE